MRKRRHQLHFALAVLSLLVSVLPFAGLLGAVPVFLSRRNALRSSWWTRATLASGALAMVIASGWCVVYAESPRAVVRAESPVLRATDETEGESFVSGALYPWAERRDVLPVNADGERVFQIDGIAGETVLVDSASLLLVPHDPAVEIVPTTTQTLVGVRDAIAAPLVFEDGEFHGEPVRTWRMSFPHEKTRGAMRATLVLTARTTAFAEQAFARYLATMGQGMDPFMASVTKETCSDACRQEVWDDETERLGIPLVVEVDGGARQLVSPVGSVGERRFGVVIDVPSTDPVVVRLSATPDFWQVTSAELAPYAGDVTPVIIAPSHVRLRQASGDVDVRELVLASDRTRAVLHEHERLEVRFPARSPDDNSVHDAFISLRGHYRVPTGGRRFVNLGAIAAHRLGLMSLPRFAASLPHDPMINSTRTSARAAP